MKTISALLLLGVLLTGAFAQRPRAVEPEPADKTHTAKPKPAPKTLKAKYEGGVFGYTKTMEGTLTFDDENNRLLFKDKKPPKEISIPYEAITSGLRGHAETTPSGSHRRQPHSAIYALPAGFIKTKVRYLTLQYNDPDSKVSGITSFKLENKEILESALVTLADKADMTLRGDIYVKKKADESSKATPK